jgi:hypothetical protein
MNIYFLVEGKRTEMKVYPKWLTILIPELTRVQWHHQVIDDNYCIFTGDGFPSLLDNHLGNSIEDINKSKKFDYFVICLDSDDDSLEERKQQVLDYIEENKIETWFLGNKRVFKSNPQSEFLNECISFYNVKENDPELMDKPTEFYQSTAMFHSAYLQEILAERRIKYSKKNPQGVTEESFLNELIKRNDRTNHIPSFKNFIDFCEKIRKELTK